MAKRGRRRTKVEIERDRARVAELYIQGWTQYDIAQEIGVTQPQIAYDLKAVQKSWQESARQDFDVHVAEQLAKIDEVERRAWAAWERSIGTKRTATKRTEAARDEKGAVVPVKQSETMQAQDRDGNAQWLDVILKCVDRRCKLLGLDAPEKQDIDVQVTAHQPTTFTPQIYAAAQETFFQHMAALGSGEDNVIEGQVVEVRESINSNAD